MTIICLVLGNFFASQILTTFGSQVLTTSSGLNTTTITTLALGQTAIAKCPASPCTIEVNIGEHVTVTEVITGTASHVIPTIQNQATENLRAFLDALGIIFLFATAALQLYRWKSQHK